MRTFDDTRPIDLHLHSSESDGTEPPAVVVAQAVAAGVGTLALTDHDTFSGWAAAAAAAQDAGVTFVPGMEFSTDLDGASLHMLAYLPNPEDGPLLEELARIRDDRVSRAERIVAAIGADYPLTWADVLAQTGDGATIGRPHIADALVRRGIVANREEAFAGILHQRSGYTRPHYAPHPAHAIELIHGAGGVAVLAHPGSRGRRALRDGNLPALVAAGLDGVEIAHRENDELAQSLLRGYARKFDLIVTGSSDYHGAGKPNRIGEHTTAPAQLRRILERGTGAVAVFPR